MKIKHLCIALLTITIIGLLASCGEYNKVLKSNDPELKLEYAKKYFDEKKYGRTTTLLEEIQSAYIATSKEQEVLFLLAQSYFYDKDYVSATARYNRYFSKFPKGEYAESSKFNAAYGLFLDSAEVKLDQTNTIRSLEAFQSFLEYFPQSPKAREAEGYMLQMQNRLAQKELYSAQLYYNLGYFMGNNYEACVVTAREALKSYNYPPYGEEFQILIVRSKFEEAELSYDAKKPVRYRNVMDEHFNYINMYPNGKYLKESTRYFEKAKKAVGIDENELEQEIKVNN